jgi:hypothetical protein
VRLLRQAGAAARAASRQHGKAKLILLKLWGELDEQIEAAVRADRGELQ